MAGGTVTLHSRLHNLDSDFRTHNKTGTPFYGVPVFVVVGKPLYCTFFLVCVYARFTNIGKIPDFDKVIAFVRSMGMSLNVVIQNLAQLKHQIDKTWFVKHKMSDKKILKLLEVGSRIFDKIEDMDSNTLVKEVTDLQEKNKEDYSKWRKQ